MLVLLLFFTLSSVNASTTTLKNGKYSNSEYGLEIHVKNGEAKTAILHKDITIPLIKDGDTFSGDITDDDIKYSAVVTDNTKKSIYTTITTERTLSKPSEKELLYDFKDLGFAFLVSNNGLIKNIEIGINKETVTKIDLDTDGAIKNYNEISDAGYSFNVKGNTVQNCESTKLLCKIVGSDNNVIEIYDAYADGRVHI